MKKFTKQILAVLATVGAVGGICAYRAADTAICGGMTSLDDDVRVPAETSYFTGDIQTTTTTTEAISEDIQTVVTE